MDTTSKELMQIIAVVLETKLFMNVLQLVQELQYGL